jgi:(p)ppGpp synthase/HD superfamily hydrolase
VPVLTLADVDAVAARAHAGQYDKIGVPYVNHVRAVSAGLVPFGVGMQMAGLLHDVIEDTELTAEALLAAGVPAAVVALVSRVTSREGVSYADMLDGIRGDHAATLLKISDNAHNSLPERCTRLTPEQHERLTAKYARARRVLWPAASQYDVRAILRIVNPSLLPELDAATP